MSRYTLVKKIFVVVNNAAGYNPGLVVPSSAYRAL